MTAVTIVLRPGPDWKEMTPSEYRVRSREFCALIARTALSSVRDAVSADYARDHGIDGVLQHWVADTTFRSLRLHTTPELMSVANKHPASVVWLERNLKGELKPEALKNVVAEFVHGTAAPAEEALAGVVWAQPYIERTNRHFERVLASAS